MFEHTSSRHKEPLAINISKLAGQFSLIDQYGGIFDAHHLERTYKLILTTRAIISSSSGQADRCIVQYVRKNVNKFALNWICQVRIALIQIFICNLHSLCQTDYILLTLYVDAYYLNWIRTFQCKSLLFESSYADAVLYLTIERKIEFPSDSSFTLMDWNIKGAAIFIANNFSR